MNGEDQNISPEVDLDAGDLVLYRVSYRVLRSRLADTLGVRTSTARTDDLPGRIRVGEFGLTASRRVPVWLAAHPDEHRLQTIVRETAQGSVDGAMILTFTDSGWGDELNEWARSRKCVLVPVSDVVEGGGGSEWTASTVWQVHQEALRDVLGLKSSAAKRPKAKPKKRGSRLALIEALGKSLVEVAKERVELVKEHRRSGKELVLPKLFRKDIAARAGCSSANLTQAFGDKDAGHLSKIFDALHDPDDLMRWWANRRPIVSS